MVLLSDRATISVSISGTTADAGPRVASPTTPIRQKPRLVGEGEIEWEPILRAAQGKVKYYTVEYDFAPDGREFAADSFEYLTSLTY
ncbi:hypothetical protein V5D56_13145 [Cellulosimicrobium sp. PMB13]|uniref:hypothetical protein n=1 Tax=Cellulosimicrobium sp. PMB13 TaxID=3120158 RepID=UPI003F4BFCEB